ncbi:hypothetical protein ADUPG1_010070 [Aduncisulcus paluster]|uniref:Uncharacterized protein n=1 Tax=Aduncisulcus paluster TaxID=2918883 RepID=A0ABQ5L0C4_9EUKA|nr:hypothetical protein ADUPG1_010070 [Aduncisulcus paluster]
MNHSKSLSLTAASSTVSAVASSMLGTRNYDVHKDYEALLREREASFVRTERKLMKRVKDLEAKVAEYERSRRDPTDPAMGPIRDLHTEVMSKIRVMRDKTRRLLKDKERSLTVHFTSQLSEVEDALHRELNKEPEEELRRVIIELREKIEESDWLRQECFRLHSVHDEAIAEVTREKDRRIGAEEEIERLQVEVKRLKSENARLNASLEIEASQTIDPSPFGDESTVETPLSARAKGRTSRGTPPRTPDKDGIGLKPGSKFRTKSPSTLPNLFSSTHGTRSPSIRSHPLTADPMKAESRALNVQVMTLKKSLDSYRNELGKARQAHLRVVRQRSELEMFLRQCIGDVNDEIRRVQRFESKISVILDENDEDEEDLDLKRMGRDERAMVLERLFQKRKVLKLLQSATFPSAHDSVFSSLGVSPAALFKRTKIETTLDEEFE